MNLLDEVRSLFRPALVAMSVDPAKIDDYVAMVKPAANADHGDYQANMSMALSKTLGKKPTDVAQAIIAALPANSLVDSATVAGPGFINIRLKTDWLVEQLQQIATDERLGVPTLASPKTFVIDYSGPNVAKPLHVGHLRSTIIGDSITRLLRFLGHTVISDNHLGDWGTQFGILLYGYKNLLDREAYEQNPVQELARLYKAVRILIKEAGGEDEEAIANPIAEKCRHETAKLHAGDEENLRLWNEFMPACLSELHSTYEKLGILTFNHELGESAYNPELPEIVAEQLAKGIAFDSQGAVVIPNAKGNIPQTKEELEKEDPPALIRKRDGAFTYTTTDLATVRHRVNVFHADVLLYVVDFRQSLHFKTLFAQAKRWGYTNVEFEHLSFGSVLGADGKPFGARKGAAPGLVELLEESLVLANKKYWESYKSRKEQGHDVPDLDETEISKIAENVGIGAVKYADLSQNRTSNYKFDPEKMLATDGNTSTYMQFAFARCRGIFRKANEPEERFRTNPPKVILGQPTERALALQLLRLPNALETAAAEYMPHHLTAYLWDVAKSYSSFNEQCPVLKAETPELRDSRLLLVDLTARVIHLTLDLLGIKTVERM
ncbi:arginine--tRNA ligase [Zavarzinella formosa]|uniref:arginine--tRNA ligase n=1 Tax=Zavarzinella formosa TaxID=360055 RepID=UPI000308C662|nr:arginine--tRNA ligase [Zavarzinella formosa]